MSSQAFSKNEGGGIVIYKEELLNMVKYDVKAVLVSPLAIKDDNDELRVDQLTGGVYIPGSSIAGAFRNYYESYVNKNSDENINELFGGRKSGMGKVVFYDAHLADESTQGTVSSRPGLKIDNSRQTEAKSGDIKESGTKFSRKFMEKGMAFRFVFELNNYGEEGFEKKQKELENLIKAFSVGDISLGGNKMIGYGRFKVESVFKEEYNFTNADDLLRFMLRNPKSKDVTKYILSGDYSTLKVRFKVKAKTATPLLIRDEVIRSSDEPDGINIKDGNDFIIPGSSLKGVIRSRAQRLQKTFPCIGEDIISNIFGIEAGGDNSQISRLKCFDTVIRDCKKRVYNKIKIDHFTGGTMQGALSEDEVIMGKLDIECTLDTAGLKDYKKEVGLLLLVLRDLCVGDLCMGSGYAVGWGYMKAETLELFDGENIVFGFGTDDKEALGKFDLYISKLMEAGCKQ